MVKKLNIKISFLMVFLFIVCLGSACSDSDDTYTVEFDAESFNQAKTIWRSLAIHDYSFVQDCNTAASGDYVRESFVENGECLFQNDFSTGNLLPDLSEITTIDDIFTYIESEYSSLQQKPEDPDWIRSIVTVKYDDIYYYPSYVARTKIYENGDASGMHVSFYNFSVTSNK